MCIFVCGKLSLWKDLTYHLVEKNPCANITILPNVDLFTLFPSGLKVDLPAAGSPDIPCSEDSGWVGACVISAGSIMTLSIAGRGWPRLAAVMKCWPTEITIVTA